MPISLHIFATYLKKKKQNKTKNKNSWATAYGEKQQEPQKMQFVEEQKTGWEPKVSMFLN